MKKIIQRETGDGIDQKGRRINAPNSLEELEAQLPKSIESLDAGKGVSSEKIFQRLRKRIKNAVAKSERE